MLWDIIRFHLRDLYTDCKVISIQIARRGRGPGKGTAIQLPAVRERPLADGGADALAENTAEVGVGCVAAFGCNEIGKDAARKKLHCAG